MKNQKNNDEIGRLYASLYVKYYKDLLRMFMKTNKSMADAEDAASSFLLKFCETMTDGRDIAGKINDAFVKGSFKNYMNDLFRKKRPFYFSGLENGNQNEYNITENRRFDIAGSDSADERINAATNKYIISSCYKMMKEEDVKYIRLRFEKGFNNIEIGEQLSQTTKYIAVRVNRARASFRMAFKKLGYRNEDY